MVLIALECAVHFQFIDSQLKKFGAFARILRCAFPSTHLPNIFVCALFFWFVRRIRRKSVRAFIQSSAFVYTLHSLLLSCTSYTFCFCVHITVFCFCVHIAVFCFCVHITVFCFCVHITVFCFCVHITVFCFCVHVTSLS